VEVPAVSGEVVSASIGDYSAPAAYVPPTRVPDHVADRPFRPAQLSRIDEALTLASRETGLTFSLYVGPLGQPSRQHAEELFMKLSSRQPNPVLVAISPGERRLEIVTGGESNRRIPNRACGLAALAMRASFTNGDLTGGIVGGLRQLADAAGPA
jgi:hypothetical protein